MSFNPKPPAPKANARDRTKWFVSCASVAETLPSGKQRAGFVQRALRAAFQHGKAVAEYDANRDSLS